MADSSPLKLAYKIVRWSLLVLLVWSLLLILHQATPPNVPYDSTASARVQQKFAAADQAKAEGSPSQVELDATELNSYLHDNLSLEGATPPRSVAALPANANSSDPPSSTDPPDSSASQADPPAVSGADPQTVAQAQSTVKDVKIDMEGDLINAYVVFDVHGKDLSLELNGHLIAQDGYLSFQPVSGKLGSMPLPQWMLDSAVEKLMASPENREKLKLPDDVRDIQVADGQVVVTYK